MSMKKKFEIRTLFLAMLLVLIVLVPAVSAQENSKVSYKSSELEKGLVDALNSNTKNLSTNDVVVNYVKTNKDKISKTNFALNNTVLGKNQSRTYQLKDGSVITFEDDGFFSISSIKEEPNNITVKQTAAKASLSTTNVIQTSHFFYNWVTANILLYRMYTKGYFDYNGQTVTGHLVDAWYVRDQPAFWQVSDWSKGVINYSTHTRSDVYGTGYFQFGILVNGIGLVLREHHDNLYIKCNQYGSYQGVLQET
jgi:hypothetical protein